MARMTKARGMRGFVYKTHMDVSSAASAYLAREAVPQSLAAAMLALSTQHFENGQRELQQGHLEMAKAQFNRALEVLLESPFGGRSEPTIREHFDRLVERISAYEVTALAQRSGGHAVLFAAPAELKRGLDVWGPAPEAFSLMREIKRRFDPGGLLNPGRFVGGL